MGGENQMSSCVCDAPPNIICLTPEGHDIPLIYGEDGLYRGVAVLGTGLQWWEITTYTVFELELDLD